MVKGKEDCKLDFRIRGEANSVLRKSDFLPHSFLCAILRCCHNQQAPASSQGKGQNGREYNVQQLPPPILLSSSSAVCSSKDQKSLLLFS